jgi:hypothetical protein
MQTVKKEEAAKFYAVSSFLLLPCRSRGINFTFALPLARYQSA